MTYVKNALRETHDELTAANAELRALKRAVKAHVEARERLRAASLPATEEHPELFTNVHETLAAMQILAGAKQHIPREIDGSPHHE